MKNRLGPDIIPVVEYLRHQPAYGYGRLAVLAHYLSGVAVDSGALAADLIRDSYEEAHKKRFAAQ
jgi:hypothetical protein